MLTAALAPLLVASSSGGHLRVMSTFDWAPDGPAPGNLGLTFSVGYPTPADTGLAGQLAAYKTFGIPSLYYMEISKHAAQIWTNGVGLQPGWEEVVEREVKGFISPHFGPGKALRGVALGDEMCCRNITCWAQYAPYTAKLRDLLGPSAILYTNECMLAGTPGWPDKITIAPDFDFFSVDTYQWDYRQPTVGKAEVGAIKSAYGQLFSKLGPHQQLLIIPGTFGCSSTSAVGKVVPVLAGQQANVLDKLNGLFEWAKTEPRIGGMISWHYRNRTGNMAPGSPCDMRLGAEAMPQVVDKLHEIGQYIGNWSDDK
jgi:hypothetical protein